MHDYITESEAWISWPAEGDEIDIEIAPGEVISTYVIESTEDSVTLYGDDTVISLLETIRRYGPVGSNRAVGYAFNEEALDEDQVLDEISLSDIDIERQDWERMGPEEFQRVYGKSKDQWQTEYDQMFSRLQGQTQKAMQRTEKRKDPDYCPVCDRPDNRCVCESERPVVEDQFFQRVMELAGCSQKMEENEVDTTDPLADKAAALAPVGADDSQEPVATVDEAEYQGREVPLNKPMAGDVKKSKVYVKDPSTGNVKKVNFGDPDMKIKKSNPARRKSFRARHRCDNPGPKTKARYWSCRAW